MLLRIINTDPVHFGEFVDAGMTTEAAIPAGLPPCGFGRRSGDTF